MRLDLLIQNPQLCGWMEEFIASQCKRKLNEKVIIERHCPTIHTATHGCKIAPKLSDFDYCESGFKKGPYRSGNNGVNDDVMAQRVGRDRTSVIVKMRAM